MSNNFNPTKYKNDFTREKYDRLNIVVPKGQKDIITTHYKSKGYRSLNDYINSLINADIYKTDNENIK